MKSQLKHLKYWLIFLIFCLSYFFLLVSNASSESLIGKVIAVHDGDTITLQNESGYKKFDWLVSMPLNLSSLMVLNHAQHLGLLFLRGKFKLIQLSRISMDVG